MAKMRAIDAAVRILEKEGVTIAFGVWFVYFLYRRKIFLRL